jgi:ABC-type Fe3+-hydroxamate transport system substrate-binding protein
MAFFVDQLGRSIELVNTPTRIISIVPSQTELLFDLGLESEVVGITKFCVHPKHWDQTKTIIGGTKQLHIHKIQQLIPHLIIANKEENVREQVEELAKEFPVWISDVNDFETALSMIDGIAEITNHQLKGKEILDQIKLNFSSLVVSNQKPGACYLIWKDPYMSVGGDTFINDMLHFAGFQNIFENRNRYPQVTIEEIKTKNCQVLLLASEPYPFKQQHVEELQTFLPGVEIVLVDGEMFSWYGSRLLKAASYFHQLQNQVLSLKHARGS